MKKLILMAIAACFLFLGCVSDGDYRAFEADMRERNAQLDRQREYERQREYDRIMRYNPNPYYGQELPRGKNCPNCVVED